MRIYKQAGWKYGIEHDDGTRHPVGTRLKALAIYNALNPKPARAEEEPPDGRRRYEAYAPPADHHEFTRSSKPLTHCLLYKLRDQPIRANWTVNIKYVRDYPARLRGYGELLEWAHISQALWKPAGP